MFTLVRVNQIVEEAYYLLLETLVALFGQRVDIEGKRAIASNIHELLVQIEYVVQWTVILEISPKLIPLGLSHFLIII